MPSGAFKNSLTAGQAARPSSSEREALKGAEVALKAKPEKDYTAADWAGRAFAAYADGKLDLAAEYSGRRQRATACLRPSERNICSTAGSFLASSDAPKKRWPRMTSCLPGQGRGWAGLA